MIPTRRDDADDATPTTTRAMEDATTADATTADGRDATTDDEMNRTNRSVPRATSVREKIALYDGADEAAKARTRANDEESSVSRETVAKLRASDLEEALTRAFDAFGSFGRRRDAETRMDGARFAKLCKEVIFKGAGDDAREGKLRRAEIAFARRAKLNRKIDYEDFRALVMEDCANIDRGDDEDGEVDAIATCAKLIGCEPSVESALSPGKVRFHDERERYTGVQAEKHGRGALERAASRRGESVETHAAPEEASLPDVKGLFTAFESFLQFSPPQSALTCSRWVKICEDCELFEAHGLDHPSAGIVFNAVATANRKTLDFDAFKTVLHLAAQRAGSEFLVFACAVAAGEPRVRSALANSPSSPLRFHDEVATYTATHKATHRDKVLSPRALSIRKRAGIADD